MSQTRDNHFVAQWYQKGFMDARDNQLCHLTRKSHDQKNGEAKTIYSKKWYSSAQRFYKRDLYSTFFDAKINDEIEQKLFGPIDNNGSKAVRAFLTDDQAQWHENFQDLFIYLDAQKLRTPKGLDWIKSKYPQLNQVQLMVEMQSLRSMHCTLWVEGVRELVSAEDSDVKFIVSDHPVTIYNYACPPESKLCGYPNDPDISLKGSQTIFPLDKNRCLILTNLEYAQNPDNANPLEQRINAIRIRPSMVNTIEFINIRKLTADEVAKINYVIKNRAQSSVAAGREEWLYPEIVVTCPWHDIKHVLLPPSSELYRFGGEIYAKFENGEVHYQDAFGRTAPQNGSLNKVIDEGKIGRNDFCGCGSGHKYKRCCLNVPVDLRTTWDVASIRERNLAFCGCIRDVLGLDNGKTWVDIRRELSEDQISKIYGFYSFLWPRETDIYSLLPKSDGKFRGLYTGPLDIRVIKAHALPIASVFDEFLIETPITNPNNVKPDFNPIQSPQKYKYQALKDFLFLLTMEPFIELGLVNLIPDPSEFDLALMRAMMEMARNRNHTEEILCEQERRLYFRLAVEDLLNSIGLAHNDTKIQLLMYDLGLTKEKAIETITELELHAEVSPLMLLQQLNLGEGGQFIQHRIGPNYEMSLLMAQTTGSVLVTDSDSRWRELVTAQHQEKGITSYPWNNALGCLKVIPLDHQFLEKFQKSQGLFSTARNLIKLADHMVLNNDRDVTKLTLLADQATSFTNQIERSIEPLITSNFRILSPEGGFYDIHVQRLLARSSCTKYDHRVRSIYSIGLASE
ncbi:DUF4238 domain-containing protein [Desulfococcaceae bacterium OttesenSCG-928-F15]|nr:DUF4238 domain-containing protein [Desulfococcaceae bacterium OttesenSCG-928-F15]